jgi:hypothetical protein
MQHQNNVPRSNVPKQKTRQHNDDVASKTGSKFGHTDQNVTDRTRSKLQAICNSSSKEMFFPLYDAVMLKGQEIWKNVDVPIHLGASKCLIYHSALMKTKSQSELDWLRQLHILDKEEDDLDESWECTKVLKYCEDSRKDMSTNHNCLVEWNDINNSQSWVNFFALSLSNPTPIISFARKHNLLDNMAFQHLVHYCKARNPVDAAKTYKAVQHRQLVLSTSLEYKCPEESRMLFN